MKINSIKISYSTTIPIMSYGVNDKVGAEIEYNVDGDDFDFDSLFSSIKETVDESVRNKYPHLYTQEVNGGVPLPSDYMKVDNIVAMSKDGTQYPLTPSESYTLEEIIHQCKTLQELSMYEKIIDKKPESEEKRKLWLTYDEVYAKLSNQ